MLNCSYALPNECPAGIWRYRLWCHWQSEEAGARGCVPKCTLDFSSHGRFCGNGEGRHFAGSCLGQSNSNPFEWINALAGSAAGLSRVTKARSLSAARISSFKPEVSKLFAIYIKSSSNRFTHCLPCNTGLFAIKRVVDSKSILDRGHACNLLCRDWITIYNPLLPSRLKSVIRSAVVAVAIRLVFCYHRWSPILRSPPAATAAAIEPPPPPHGWNAASTAAARLEAASAASATVEASATAAAAVGSHARRRRSPGLSERTPSFTTCSCRGTRDTVPGVFMCT